jgi:hypothetical protein
VRIDRKNRLLSYYANSFKPVICRAKVEGFAFIAFCFADVIADRTSLHAHGDQSSTVAFTALA